jgi:hypothetical protein
MSHQPRSTATFVAPEHIWSDLPSDLQQRTVRLLAQLAYARLHRHTESIIKETHSGNSTQQPQDPGRPS